MDRAIDLATVWTKDREDPSIHRAFAFDRRHKDGRRTCAQVKAIAEEHGFQVTRVEIGCAFPRFRFLPIVQARPFDLDALEAIAAEAGNMADILSSYASTMSVSAEDPAALEANADAVAFGILANAARNVADRLAKRD